MASSTHVRALACGEPQVAIDLAAPEALAE